MSKPTRILPSGQNRETITSGANLNRLYNPLVAIPSAAVLDPAIWTAIVGLRSGGGTCSHGSRDEPPDDTGSASIASITVAATVVAICPAPMPAMAMSRIVASGMPRSRRRRIRRSKGEGNEYSQREDCRLPFAVFPIPP